LSIAPLAESACREIVIGRYDKIENPENLFTGTAGAGVELGQRAHR
jgi:hypothetical protein